MQFGDLKIYWAGYFSFLFVSAFYRPKNNKFPNNGGQYFNGGIYFAFGLY